jgi:large subunit ribosomal protein L14
MIQKNSILKPFDNCGVLKVRVFHLYKSSQGRFAFIGDFIKVSAREVKPENPIKKKSKHRSIIIKSKFRSIRKDGSFVTFDENSLILLKKRLTPKGRILKGLISNDIKRKKFVSSFAGKI